MLIVEYFNYRNYEHISHLFLLLFLQQEVQKEPQEQRDLIEDIARQSSSSDLEQENQTQSQKPTGYDTNLFPFQTCHMVAWLFFLQAEERYITVKPHKQQFMFSVFRSIGGSLYVPQQPAELEVTWVQLLPRLDLLLDSINTEQDRTRSEVNGSPI